MPIYETIFILLMAGLVWFWLDSLKAREIGVRAAQAACEEEGLQFLDETVVGRLLRPARDDDGRLRLRRVFQFEYSDTGDNRRSGSVTLLGHQIEYLHVRPQLYIVPSTRDSHETRH
jgi:hypothetical protein